MTTTSAFQFQQDYAVAAGLALSATELFTTLNKRNVSTFGRWGNLLSRFLSASTVLISIAIRYAKSSVFFPCHLQVNHYPLSGSCLRLVY